MPLDQTEANRQLAAGLGKTAYTAPTTPMLVKLATTVGTATAAGTEVVNGGGSAYAPQNLTSATPAAPTNGSIANNAAVTFTNMPDTNSNSVKSIEIVDSAGRRYGYAQLVAAKTTNLGDSLSFAASALTLQTQ